MKTAPVGPQTLAAQALAKTLVDQRPGSTLPGLRDQYDGFRAALATPHLRGELDVYLAKLDPELAGLLGADAKSKAHLAEVAVLRVQALLGRDVDGRRALAQALFDPALVAQVVRGDDRYVALRGHAAVDGKVQVDVALQRYVRATQPPQYEDIATTRILVDPSDLSFAKVG